MFLFSNHSFIEIRKSLLVAIARMEVKNSKQSIIKINLNGFKVRVKALIHGCHFQAKPLFVLIVNTVRKRFGD